jgi:DNA-binding PadR family transcriptional regulator
VPVLRRLKLGRVAAVLHGLVEKRGWILGRWVEKDGQRRRRYYRLTAQGAKILAAQKRGWETFVEAIQRITGPENA